MDRKSKSPYDLSGPERQGWAALAESQRKQQTRQLDRMQEQRRGKSPYEC